MSIDQDIYKYQNLKVRLLIKPLPLFGLLFVQCIFNTVYPHSSPKTLKDSLNRNMKDTIQYTGPSSPILMSDIFQDKILRR